MSLARNAALYGMLCGRAKAGHVSEDPVIK
jgi:hypothetical protein